MATTFKTSAEITQEYIDNIVALNPNANPQVIGTDWWVKANIQGGIVSGVYQDAYNLNQAIFIQNASGSILDYYLASGNLTPRLAASPATGYAYADPAPGAPVSVLAGTQLTLGSNTYVVQSTTLIGTGSGPAATLVPIESLATGSGTALYNGTDITFATPVGGLTFLVVSSMNDGANEESDSDVRYRILQAKRSPKTGGSETDYRNWCISQPNITNVFLQVANLIGQNQLNIYLMSGTGIVDDILANITPGSYSRVTTVADIDTCENYVLTVKPLFDQLYFNTVYTYVVNSTLDFNITNLVLIDGVDLTTVLPGFTITVSDLIKRELRRAVLSAPLGGTEISSAYYIIMDSIQGTIYKGLNSVDGKYAKIIVSFRMDFNSLLNDILVPSSVNGTGAYPAVYDVNYTNINIST